MNQKRNLPPVRGLAVLSIRTIIGKLGTGVTDKTCARLRQNGKKKEKKRNLPPVRGLAVICIRTIIQKLGTDETDKTVTRKKKQSATENKKMEPLRAKNGRQPKKKFSACPRFGCPLYKNNNWKVGDRRRNGQNLWPSRTETAKERNLQPVRGLAVFCIKNNDPKVGDR